MSKFKKGDMVYLHGIVNEDDILSVEVRTRLGINNLVMDRVRIFTESDLRARYENEKDSYVVEHVCPPEVVPKGLVGVLDSAKWYLEREMTDSALVTLVEALALAKQSDPQPCPWPGCDGNPNIIEVIDSYYVECDGCGLSSPWEGTEQEAIAAWNRLRVEEDL